MRTTAFDPTTGLTDWAELKAVDATATPCVVIGIDKREKLQVFLRPKIAQDRYQPWQPYVRRKCHNPEDRLHVVLAMLLWRKGRSALVTTCDEEDNN